MHTQYDYIIAGAGASGLSLAMYMLQANLLEHKTLLIIDKDLKKSNDRTWCFWETEKGLFEEIVYKKWENLKAVTPQKTVTENIAPYQYKMIRGIDFYDYCLRNIKNNANVTFLNESINSITNLPNQQVVVAANKIEYTATYCFSSILLQAPKLTTKTNYLLQHFKGEIIETTTPVFDVNTATYMDFTVPQTHGTTFGYVLPLTPTKALVEYTLFTKDTLTQEQYSTGLNNYIKDHLSIDQYKVIEVEQGVIPMTDYVFAKNEGNIIYIGTAGGNTRGSTGYTFSFIQKNCKAIVEAIVNGKNPNTIKNSFSKNASFYDSILLTVLANEYVTGQKVFSSIFEKVSIKKVLSFLNDDNKFANDLQIIWSQPKLPFMKAVLKKWF